MARRSTYGPRVTGQGEAPPRTTARHLGEFPPKHSESFQKKLDDEAMAQDALLRRMQNEARLHDQRLKLPTQSRTQKDMTEALGLLGLENVYYDAYSGEYVNADNGKRALDPGHMFNDSESAVRAIRELQKSLRDQEAAESEDAKVAVRDRDAEYRGLTPEQAELLREMDAA